MILPISLAGCYGDINVSCEFQAPGWFDHDSLNLYFFHSAVVRRPAKGISSFPDGGSPRILFKKVTFRKYNLARKSLETIFNYGSLPWSAGRWKFNMHERNDSVTFMIEPVSGWENELKRGLDSAYYQKFRYLFIYQSGNGDISHSEPTGDEIFATATVPVSDMKKLTGDLKYSDWGIIIGYITNTGRKQMIKDISELRGNQEYRNALIESISGEMTSQEMNLIISDINIFMKSLDDYERLLKKDAAENTINYLESVIE